MISPAAYANRWAAVKTLLGNDLVGTLPQLDVKNNCNHSPHVLLLGAGASLAACPNGDKNGLEVPLMKNLAEVVGLDKTFLQHGLKYGGEDFEAIYDDLVQSGKSPELVEEINAAVESYFSKLELPDEATIYDYLILSLRNKDMIATFNWDPFLAQAFWRNMQIVGYEQMPQIAFLHGNVAIGVCKNCRTKGWRYNTCTKCGETFSAAKLLYPVRRKDYSSDEFLASEWERLQHYIRYAYYLTIFGYSAPATDVEARNLMLDVWSENTTRDLAQIDLIDVIPKEEVKKNWQEFIIRDRNYGIRSDFFETYLATHPRRSCDALAMATLQQRPWEDNHFPRDISLEELQAWISPLVEEEKTGRLSGQPCYER